MIPLLTIFTTNAWGAETLKTTCEGTGSGYGTRRTTTYDGIGWVLASGQTGYLGTGNATSHGNTKPTAADLPVVKAQYGSATTTTTGYYYYYTSTAIANVTKIEITYTAKKGSATVNAYVVSSSTAASSGSATWSKPTLASGTGLSAQGTNIASAVGTYTFKLNAKETSSKYYGVILYTGSYSRLTDGAIKIYVDDAAASCTSNPTVSAASNSSVTSTTATVSCSSGISSLGSAGCSITDYGFVIGTSSNPAIGGSGVTKHQVGTTYTSTGASFSKDLTGLSAETTYYVRPYATNGNGTAYGTQTSFTTSALPKYTITYHVGSGTCATSSWTQTTAGQSTTLPTATPSCDGWSFAGWCTSSAGDEDDNTTSPGTILTGSYTPTSNVDLYAVYTKTEGGGSSNVTFNFGYSTDWGQSGSWSGTSKNEVSATKGGVTVTYTRNGTNLYANSTSIRFYPSNTLNFACSSAITAITFTVSTYQTDITSDVGTCTATSSELSWTGSANSVTFTRPSGASSYAQMSAATITITSGTTYYMTDYECAATPTITVSKTLIEFGDKKMGTNYQETFTVSGSDLSADINLSVGGANPTLFSIDKTSLTQSGGTVSTTTITVTWTPSASYNAATITISSTGATSKTVALSGTGKWEVVWKNDGVTHATTLVASGTKPTFPATPTSCDATSTSFVGWTNAEWSGKIDNVAGKTIHTNNTTMDNVSANGTIYYAVFAEADFEEGPDVGTTIYAENFSGFSGDSDPSGTYTNSHTGTTLYSGSVTYSKTNGSGTTQTKSESLAGGSSPELMVAKYSGTFTVAGIPRCGASELTLTYKQNGNSLTSSVSGTGYSGGTQTSTSGTTSADIICGSGSTFTLTFTGPSGNSNVRMDDISITVKSKAGSYVQYLTNCCTSYDITKAGGGTVGGGTFSADATSACEGATVTLSTNICSGYTVGAWDVYKTGTPATKITVTSNQFTMPAYGVTIALTTTAKVDHFKDAMHETSGYTGDGYAVSGCNQTVPSLSNTTPASECEGEHYKFIGWVDDAHVDSDGTLLTGYSIVSGGTTSWNATGTTYYAIWAKEL